MGMKQSASCRVVEDADPYVISLAEFARSAKKVKSFFRRHVRRKNSFGRSLCKPLAPTKAGKARRDKREYLKRKNPAGAGFFLLIA